MIVHYRGTTAEHNNVRALFFPKMRVRALLLHTVFIIYLNKTSLTSSKIDAGLSQKIQSDSRSIVSVIFIDAGMCAAIRAIRVRQK